ncbi:MarR family winged helix-turn-helix transcriptional regulator [Rhodoferax sp. U11-2br]|uniref:MarR family winged helix-turn-helix transcriptional regulator n=1 Tax=Rhodoferax sp. U11-2br TaxID=2838878 RepID=UPI001BE9CDAE|nr:MarR family transcriptional regulator [Rhodoferax sp. U11-2br]MBT3066159.1 MarR family transcriptional regulator [Rhodoferax sp. U11-2br]
MDDEDPIPFVDKVNTRYLETLVGYNARRAALVIIAEFMERMAVYELRTVDFSVLSLITHNPGITSKQLCNTLGIQAPNLVSMVNALEQRDLIKRLPHPNDGRAMGLHLTELGEQTVRRAEKTAAELERDVTAKLSPQERKTLLALLKKIYK